MIPVKNKIVEARLGTVLYKSIIQVLYKKEVRRKKIAEKKTDTYTFD